MPSPHTDPSEGTEHLGPEPRTDRQQGRGFHGRLVLLGVVVPTLLILVVAAGFAHPWNPGAGIGEGRYRQDYTLTQQVMAGELDRCLTVTTTGTLTATYQEPFWSLGGPGWSDPELSGTTIALDSTSDCSNGATPADLDSLKLTQFWAGPTCAEPDRRDWQLSARVGECDRDLVAGVSAGSAKDPSSEYSSAFDGLGPLSWRSTTYRDSVCLDGVVVVEAAVGEADYNRLIQGFSPCLDAATALRE